MSKSTTVYWNSFTYDLAGRLISTSRPISDTNPALQTTNFYFEGLTTRAVDPQLKQTSRVLNAAGQVSRSVDHNGVYQSFDYDAFGNPKRVQDSLGNTLQTSGYNSRGVLTSRADMDMGAWSFIPNALGETVSQTDAKGQTTTFAFDSLGRPTSRVEAEGTTTLNWGNSSAAKNIGKLASIYGPGYSESYSFDALGRSSATTISADTTYSIDYTYNAKGYLNTVAYPTSTNGCRFTIQLGYSYEFLKSISNASNASQCGSTGETYWTANEGNGFVQIIRETLGNGLVTNRTHDAVTGLLKSIQSGLGGGNAVQNLAYTWDQVGNLASRRDVNQSNLTETFLYDNLYRLDYSQLNGVTNLDMAYDALGNITSKSDVGNYTYHATKKHQVTSTSNGWSFAYDNNGNMTSGRNATIIWTSFNYPASISNGLDTSSFSYTPDRQYWRQISNYTNGGAATTIYVGGLLEKVTTSAGTDFRHMIRAGGSSIIVSRLSTGTNTVKYVTSDHLGSASAITNSSGGVLANSSFDAFGKRRGSNWSGSPSASDWTAIASTTRRGYTDHTMLDNLNLIHMNGRVHDPVLGRFLSADPYIFEPGLTQSYNRYSYVNNNPLSATDPSGFERRWMPYNCPNLGSGDPNQGGCGGTWVDIPDYRPYSPEDGHDPNGTGSHGGPNTPPLPADWSSGDSAGAWSGTGVQTGPYCDMSPTGCDSGAKPFRNPVDIPSGGEHNGEFCDYDNGCWVHWNTGELLEREPALGQPDKELFYMWLGGPWTRGMPRVTASGRLARDAAVNPRAPAALPTTGRSIGRASHDRALQQELANLPARATDIRVNQHQVNALGQRVGINRPDLQYTLDGRRYYVEYEGVGAPRGALHTSRLNANDPAGIVRVREIP